MNKNKGIVSLGLVLAIVLGVAVVGGGAYYLGKGSNNVEVKIDENNIKENPNGIAVNPVNPDYTPNPLEVPTGPFLDSSNYVPPAPLCSQTSVPSIKVISPNGGEVFTVGQKINVKWSSCNVSPSLYDIVVALHQDGDWKNVIYLDNATINDGSEIFTVPANIVAGSYKIRVGSSVAKIGQDFSDNIFTIPYATGMKQPINWETYTNSDYGFSFNYPNSWKLNEDKSKKEITIDTNDVSGGVDGKSYPSWNITFKVTDKTFFTQQRVSTKMGEITYNQKESAIFADDRCIKVEKLLGGTVQAARYGGSLMSDPAYSNFAILTSNGGIIIVNNYQGVDITPDISNQLSVIANSFKLLNGNTVFVPDCAK